MDMLREWITGITITAILAAIAKALTEKSGQRGVIRLFCGVCVALAILAPLRSNAPRELWRSLKNSLNANERAASYGQDVAASVTQSYAAEQAAAYLDAQAAAIADGVSFTLTLSEDLKPIAVSVRGPAAARDAVISMAAQTLGLSTDDICYISEEGEDTDGNKAISRMD
ncbi:MAG: hypothetical protein VB111_00240 [Clostridiaceae bacterium]|nr:hypothetical protein [Clostridiaceae bacterium]